VEKVNDILFIDVEKIMKNPNQPRSNFSENSIFELAQSIKQVGVIQPISVRKIGEKFELIAGERRLMATKKAGFTKIPTVVLEVDDQQSAILSLVENIQRENLGFLEEAYAYKTLIEKYNINQKEVSVKMGKSQSTISNKLRLLKLDTQIRNRIVENGLTERHARKLLIIKEKNLQNEIIDKIVKNQLNVKQTDVLVNNILNVEKVKKRKINTQFKLNSNIYVNTIKKAYDEIVDVGIEAEFEKIINDKYIELKIKIPK
jgi:ParB family chromosome partitioning protein